MRSSTSDSLAPLSGWIKPSENRRRIPLIILGCALLLLLPAVAFADEPHKNVLIFQSDDTTLPGNVAVDRAIRSTLKEGWKSPVQVYDEGLDSFRIPYEKYDSEIVRLLQRKYDGVHFDLVFALGQPALKFLLQHRGELFSNVPIVFLVADESRLAGLYLGSNITGVWGKMELAPTLDMALALHPQTEQVVVVAGNAPIDRGWLALARKEFGPYEGRLAFTYLTDLTPEEVRQRLAVLPNNSVVIVLAFDSDITGKSYTSLEVISLLSPTSRAPIYAPAETFLGSGMVGGRLLSFEALGLAGGKMGLRILAGESAQSIDRQAIPSITAFDWRQLRRWGIDEAKLPPGSIVRYKEFSVWELYRWQIIGAIALIVLQAFGIVWLLFTRSKRRQAEKRSSRFASLAAAEHQHLDEIVANVPGIVWESRLEPGDPIPKTTFVSPYLGKMLGYSAGEWLSKPGFWLSVVVEEDREQMKKTFARVLETGEEGVAQVRCLTKDERVLWVETHLTAIRDEDGKPVGLRGVTMNISERLQAERALQENQTQLAAIIGSAMDAIISIDERQRVVLFNNAAEAMFGCSVREALGQPFNNFIPKPFRDARQDGSPTLNQADRSGLNNGSFASLTGRRTTGEDFPVDVSISEIEIDGERFYTMILRDTTERLRAEEAVQERKEQLSEAQRIAKIGSWEWEPITDTVTWSDEMFHIMGREPTLPAPSYAEHPFHYTSESWQHLKSAVEKALQDGTPYELELEMIHADGSLVWTNARGEVLRDQAGAIVKIRGTLQDIAERKRAEQALSESEHRFQLVSQATKDILYEWNLHTGFVWWNDSAMRSVFGYPLEEMRHDVNWWEERLHPDDKDRIDVSVSEALGGVEQMWENEYRFRKMDNSYAYVYHRAFIIRGEGGEALRVIGSLMDFTERKQSEEKLRSALEEVNHLKNQLQEENIYLREEIKLAHHFDEIVGRSDATKYVLFKIEQVAPTDSTVLITGETGTGKELVARAIHRSSLRKDGPLVRVNCAALSPTLIESELFGHEKGAFTGATGRKIGRFELANDATIFLDEIGELPLELQAKLLRVIQENEFERLGSSKTIKVDARIIAATNRNLKNAVERGAFREDLWYRLNVFPITVPPLRDRKEDIPGLVEHFVRRFSDRVGRRITSIPPGTMRILQDYPWPGNVRELANVLERAVINTQGTVLRVVEHFEKAQTELPRPDKTLEEMEKEYIIRILESTSWRIEGYKGAARILGLNPSTLRTRMAKLGIQKLDQSSVMSSTAQ